jgi:hypothetical protein
MAHAQRSRGSVLAVTALLLVTAFGLLSACSYLDQDVTLEDCVTGWNQGYWKDGEPPEQAEVFENGFGTTGRAFGFIAERAAVVTRGYYCAVLFDLGGKFIAYRSVSREPELSAPVLEGWLKAEDVQPNKALARNGVTGWNACQEDDGTIVLLEDGACTPHDPAVKARPVEEEEEAKRRAIFEEHIARFDSGKHAYWLGTRYAGALFWPNTDPEIPRADAQVEYSFDERVDWASVWVLTYTKKLGTTPSCFAPYRDLCPDDTLVLARVDTDAGETVLVVSLFGDPVPAAFREQMLAALRPYEPK